MQNFFCEKETNSKRAFKHGIDRYTKLITKYTDKNLYRNTCEFINLHSKIKKIRNSFLIIRLKIINDNIYIIYIKT